MPSDPVLDPPLVEPDYVSCFEQMAAVEVDIRRRGASPHLLLRRAMLHLALGNLPPALQAARDAVHRAPREAEAHYVEGQTWLAMARVQCGATVAPGVEVPAPRPLVTLIENAYGAFCAAAECAADDPEAVHAARAMEALLLQGESGIHASLTVP